MKNVLLSVIIPTYKRPEFLGRAIDSALLSSPNGDVEVIVVPNGPDASWKEVAQQYQDEPRIIWSAIEKAHANAARNHGLELARGKYIRFLDDDDYFYPENAKKQLVDLIKSQAELSYSCLNHVGVSGSIIKSTEPEDKEDYVVAVVGRGNPTATLTIIYLKDILESLEWDISINKNQDVYWAYSICAKREFKSIYHNKPAGAWVQHDGERVSRGHKPSIVAKQTAFQLLKLAEQLKQQDRLTVDRAKAISIALWQCLHNGVMYSPLYWFKVSRKIKQLMPNQHPRTDMYKNKMLQKVDPFWIEVIISPVRWLRVFLGHKYII